jgi:hypothetical protein
MAHVTPSPAPAAPSAPDNPTLNLSANLRLAIYIVSALGSLVIAYGQAEGWGWLGESELALWGGIVALVNGLAAINVRTGAR